LDAKTLLHDVHTYTGFTGNKLLQSD